MATTLLDAATALQVAREAFQPDPRRLVGLEVEWVVHPVGDPVRRPSYAELAPLTRLQTVRGGRVTLEPGGQVELSGRPVVHLDDALDDLIVESDQVHGALARSGLIAADTPVDLVRPPSRILDLGRYRAMEAFFDEGGPAGRWMMCNTASVQINLGYGADPTSAWRVANLLAPVLVATFANSPGHDAEGHPWASLRRAVWEGIDRTRTAMPSLEGDPAEAWLRHLLDADVMLVRDGEEVTTVAPGTPFRRWAAGGLHRPVTVDDLRYHATTVFPPVRPRGWLELRVLDALPPDLLETAAIVAATALNPDVIDRTDELLSDLQPTLETALTDAARHGLADDQFATRADALFSLVCRHAHLVTNRPDRILAVRRYAGEHVAARRQPHGSTLAQALRTPATGSTLVRLRPEVRTTAASGTGPPQEREPSGGDPARATRTRRGPFAADLAVVPALAP